MQYHSCSSRARRLVSEMILCLRTVQFRIQDLAVRRVNKLVFSCCALGRIFQTRREYQVNREDYDKMQKITIFF